MSSCATFAPTDCSRRSCASASADALLAQIGDRARRCVGRLAHLRDEHVDREQRVDHRDHDQRDEVIALDAGPGHRRRQRRHDEHEHREQEDQPAGAAVRPEEDDGEDAEIASIGTSGEVSPPVRVAWALMKSCAITFMRTQAVLDRLGAGRAQHDYALHDHEEGVAAGECRDAPGRGSRRAAATPASRASAWRRR